MSITKAIQIVRDMRTRYKDLEVQVPQDQMGEVVKFLADYNFLCGYILGLENETENILQGEVLSVPQKETKHMGSERSHAKTGSGEKLLHGVVRGEGASETGGSEGN